VDRDKGLRKLANRVESFLIGFAATSLALTVAAQILLSDPSMRPLLNFAHRAEGVRIDPGALEVISVDVAGRRSASIRLETAGGEPSPVAVELDGKMVGIVPITIPVTPETEVALRLEGRGAPSRVVVTGSSAEVVFPARGAEFLVTARGCRFLPAIARP
jgi:hypothetical protein